MTDKAILDAMEAEYARRRNQDLEEETARLRTAVEECPEIGALRERQQSLISSAVLAVLQQGDPARLAREMADVRARIGALLAAHGHPADWLEPVYQCAVCRDTGYTWDPPRKPCACREQLQRSLASERIGLATDGESFAAYRTDIFPDSDPLPGLDVTQRREMQADRKSVV